MSQELQIDKMSTIEKLQTMEVLWENLCNDDNNVPSPAWHGQVLAKRKKVREERVSKPVDWNRAKNKIRKIVHEDQNS